MNAHDPARRRFLGQAIAVAVVAVAADAVAGQAAAPAAALPKLPLTNPQAKALAYTENAATVKNPLFKAGSDCANCNFYKGAKGQAYGPCQMFPQNSVSAKGWCSAWAKKA
jgi:hypothetical protein